MPNQKPITSLVMPSQRPRTVPTVKAAVGSVIDSFAQPIMTATTTNNDPNNMTIVKVGRTKSFGWEAASFLALSRSAASA
ncbi:hypothetical protein D3C80_1941930 [compost metagenome]